MIAMNADFVKERKMKFIIELDEIPNTGLYKARGANKLVFDRKGIENILKPYKEEPEIDWSKVAVDTPILVRGSDNEEWNKRYFARYENGTIYAWKDGCTSWTAYDNIDVTAWELAKLAEEGEQE